MAAVRFAFIGCGNIARFHLRALRESAHLAEVTTVVDVRRESAEKFSSLLRSPCKVGGANTSFRPPPTQSWGVFTSPIHSSIPSHAMQHCHQVFTSLSDALQWGEFDAAVLMVPHHLHESCAVQCLEAGKHVLLEKPLAHTLDSCRRLLAAAEGSDRVFMVGENSSHWPEVVEAKKLIKSGVIGEPHFAKANYWESFGRYQTFL